MKHNKGQYFTTNEILKETVYKFILNEPKIILEPSVGRGDLVDYILKQNKDIQFDMYEIDDNIKLLNSIPSKNVIYTDFLQYKINNIYKTIIGNPPYINISNGNEYLKFITKCYNLLDNNGELIFIIPSDFFKLTSSSKIINILLSNGMITHIYHPHKENLFKNATIDVLIFRYCKNKKLDNKVLYNDQPKFLINTNGIITFSNTNNTNKKCMKDYFDIYVGMVTGKEDIYKNSNFGNIFMLNGEDKLDKYILIKEFPTNNENLNNYLLSHKSDLINRKIRKFNEINWFEWGALRNIKKIENNLGKECIYISNRSRKSNVAFIDKVKYFGGSLILLIPKIKLNLHKILDYINSDVFKQNYMYSGRFVIGHRQILNSLLDISNFI